MAGSRVYPRLLAAPRGKPQPQCLGHRCTGPVRYWLVLFWFSLVPSMAFGTPCAPLTAGRDDVLPQAVYLPPLAEEGPYSIDNPGRFTEVQAQAIEDLLHRAACLAEHYRIPLAALRFTVYARTDDRGARRHILEALRQQGVPSGQLEHTGRLVVDLVASWHRARRVIERLREALSRFNQMNPALASGDPVAMVQAAELTEDEPVLNNVPPGVTRGAHPRSFVVLLALRPPLSGGTPAVSWGTAGSGQTINVYCGGAPTVSSTPMQSAPGAVSMIPSLEKADASANPSAPAQRHPRQPIDVGPPRMDLLGGIVIPLLPDTRDILFKELGTVNLGFRLALDRAEVGLRALFFGGEHSVNHNGRPQQQQVLGGGLVLQTGYRTLVSKPAVLVVGGDLGLLYASRRIQQTDFNHAGQSKLEQGLVPVLGAWGRVEIPLPQMRRLAATLELSAAATPLSGNAQTLPNVLLGAFGGMTYALR